MATKQLLFGSLSIGSIFTNTIGANQFIRLNGNTTSGSPTITNVADNGASYFGVAELRVGMELIAGGSFNTKVTVQSISGASPNATVVVSSNAAATNEGGLLRVDPGPGQIFIESGSLTFPSGQSDINASSITGSDDSQYNAGDLEWGFAIPVALDSVSGTQRTGQFAQFEVANVQSRPGGNTGVEVNLYLTASGGNMNGLPTGMTYSSTTTQGAIYNIGSENKIGPMFLGQDASINNNFGFAAGQIMASNTLDALTSGSGGGGSAFPFTGSAEISGSIDMTGSFSTLLNSSELFLIKSATAPTQSLFQIDSEGIATFRVQPDGTIPSAVEGGLYFTTASAYIGVK